MKSEKTLWVAKYINQKGEYKEMGIETAFFDVALEVLYKLDKVKEFLTMATYNKFEQDKKSLPERICKGIELELIFKEQGIEVY